MVSTQRKRFKATLDDKGEVQMAELPPDAPDMGAEPQLAVHGDAEQPNDVHEGAKPSASIFDPVELPDDEVLRIRAWALEEAKKEQRQRKIDAMKAAALAQAREEMGLVTVSEADAADARRNELITITIDLPEGGAPDGVRLDQHVYLHGHTYQVPRTVAETIFDIQSRAWISEAMFDGKRRTHYLNGRFHAPYGGGSPLGTRPWHAA